MSHTLSLQNAHSYLRFIKTILQVGPEYDYLFCHENTHSSRTVAALKKLGFLRKPRLVLLEFDVNVVRGSKLRRHLIRWFMRHVYASADLILTSSNYQQESYERAGLFKGTRVDTVASCLSDNRVAFLEAQAASAPPAPTPDTYIFSVGQTNRDFASLLGAARHFPDKRFVIMARQASEGAPENVSFVDWGTYENYMSYFVNAELIVLPLKGHQHGAGLTTLFEAWAARKPVLVAATNAIQEFVGAKDKAALTYRPEDRGDLILTLKRALDCPNLLELVADSGRACLREHFTSRAYLSQLHEKIKSLDA